MQTKKIIAKSAITGVVAITLFSSAILPSVTALADTTPQATQTTNNNNVNASSSSDRNNPADASSNNNATTNEHHTLSKPYVVYGAGTDNSVHATLNQIFDTDSSFETLTATAADYNKYINHGQDSGTTDAAMISSVAIAPADPGSGVKVNIKKFNGESNITQVTAQQYAMVAQMAGVTDVTIIVSANRPVSGESALTGVYKALADNGAKLNPQNTATANQMLDATQPAINANKGDDAYSGKLMAAIGDVSKQLAEQKQDNQKLATKQDIQNMLNQALEKQGIADKTPASSQGQITNALVSFQNSPISANKNYTKTVGDTVNNLKNSTGNIMNDAKNWTDQGMFQRFFHVIGRFFSGIKVWTQQHITQAKAFKENTIKKDSSSEESSTSDSSSLVSSTSSSDNFNPANNSSNNNSSSDKEGLISKAKNMINGNKDKNESSSSTTSNNENQSSSTTSSTSSNSNNNVSSSNTNN